MKRRQMLTNSVTTMAALATNSLASIAGTKTSASPQFIDMHTHIGTYTNGNKELTAPALVKWMDEYNIEKAVVLPLVSPESTTYLQLPDVAIKAAKEFPDRLIPFCSIDPRAIIRGGLEGLVDILRKYVDQGAKGFGEHKVGLDFDDPLMMRVDWKTQFARFRNSTSSDTDQAGGHRFPDSMTRNLWADIRREKFCLAERLIA